jgi:prolyl-tRNA editing enzyme YbaK/EbsC (Cys-tRNA(Pro) deacylase)
LPDAVTTAQLAADALGCELGQIANSLIFKDLQNETAILIMSPGGQRVDLEKVHLLTGLELARADAKFVRDQAGFVIGGVPPVAHPKPLPTILEVSLRGYAEIWASAGTPDSVFRMTPRQLQQITGGAWLDVAQR